MDAVRQVTEDDWQLLRTVRLAALEESPYAFTTTFAEACEHTDERWQQQAAGVTTTGLPIGTWLGEGGSALAAAIDDGERTHVVSVWVAPDRRGSGLFDGLMDAVEAWSPHDLLTLTVAHGNDRALAAYRRRGFEVVGDEGGEWLMERRR